MFELPLKDFEPFKVVEAESPSQKAWNGSTLQLPSGDLQLAFHAGKRTTLATLPKGGARFNFTTTDQPVAGGQRHGDALYEISLEDNTPAVYSTKLGTRERTLRYRYTADLRFSHGTVTFRDGSFFYYLQQSKPDTEAARPLHVFRFDLPPED